MVMNVNPVEVEVPLAPPPEKDDQFSERDLQAHIVSVLEEVCAARVAYQQAGVPFRDRLHATVMNCADIHVGAYWWPVRRQAVERVYSMTFEGGKKFTFQHKICLLVMSKPVPAPASLVEKVVDMCTDTRRALKHYARFPDFLDECEEIVRRDVA